MGILKVGLIAENREYFTGTDNLRGVRRVYRVVVDNDPIYDEIEILNAVDPVDAESIPQLHHQFTGTHSGVDADLTVRKITARQTADIYIWEVEVEYATDTEEEINPLLRGADIEWDGFLAKKAKTRDLDGNEFRTSAGSPYDPPVERDEQIHTLTITKNQLTSYNLPVTKLAFEDTLNLNNWFVYPAGGSNQYLAETVRCVKIKGSLQREGALEFIRVTYEFHVKESGWQLRLADQDSRYLTPGGFRNVADGVGSVINGKVFLDGVGGLLEDAKSTLNGGINGVVTSVVVAGGGGALLTKPLTALPPLECWIKIDSEVMQVTGVATDTLTVVRGQRGTTAAAHLTAAVVKLEPVFKPYREFESTDFDLLDLP